MKNPLITTALVCGFVSSALAQGTLTFVSPIGGITYSLDSITKIPFPSGNPATLTVGGRDYGQLNIAVYYDTAGTEISTLGGMPDLTGWKLFSPILHQIAPLPGGVPGTVLTSGPDISAGDNIQLEIAAWTGTATSFNAAAAGGGPLLLAWSGDWLSGGALGWTQTVGGLPPATPQAILTGPNAYNGLVLNIPEPSSLAFASLGAAALLIFRRRR